MNKLMTLDLENHFWDRKGFPGRKTPLQTMEAVQKIKGNDALSQMKFKEVALGISISPYDILMDKYTTLKNRQTTAINPSALSHAPQFDLIEKDNDDGIYHEGGEEEEEERRESEEEDNESYGKLLRDNMNESRMHNDMDVLEIKHQLNQHQQHHHQ